MKRVPVRIIVSTLLLSLMGCGISFEIVERHVVSSIENYPTLLENTDIKLRVKVEDALNTKNSTHTLQAESLVKDFMSMRKIEVIDDFGLDIEINSIYNSEAIIDNKHYIYEGMRMFEKNEEYIIYLMYSKALDGYIIPIFGGAIVPLDTDLIENSDPKILLSDFFSKLSLDPTIDQKDIKRYGEAKYRGELYNEVVHS